MSIVLAILGPIGAGKTTVASMFLNKLPKEFTFSYERYSAKIGEFLDFAELPKTREYFQKISVALEKAFGPKIITKQLIDRIRFSHRHFNIVDGIRFPYQLNDWKSAFPGTLYSIYIDASFKTRLKRYNARNQQAKEEKVSWKTFVNYNSAQTEAEIPKLRELTNFYINNEKLSKKRLGNEIDSIINKISLW